VGAALHHTEVAGELNVLRVTVSSAVQLVLGHFPDETFWVEVMDELVAEFWRLEELCLRLERPGMRICDLLLGSPLSQARWADHLDKAVGRLEAKLAARREVDVELEAMQTSAARVRGFPLDGVNGSSSLAVARGPDQHCGQ
jgi:hypothetical protein